AEVKRVDVPLGGRKVVVDHLRAQLVRARDHRPARFAGAEERVAVDLLRDGVVNDVARFEPLVLAAQPGVDPEGFDPYDLLLLLAHDLGQLFERQLDLQRVLARLIARLARAVGVRVTLAQAVADVAGPLPDAAPVLAAEAEARPVDLRQRDRDQILPLAPDQLALRD